MIRPITADDIPWAMSLAHRRYEEHFDPGVALVAGTNAMRLPTALAWRTDHGFLIANIVASVWHPKQRSLHILAICVEEGHHWEAVELLRASVGWAQEQGCEKWWLTSETEAKVDALARRVGAKAYPHYVIEFAEDK